MISDDKDTAIRYAYRYACGEAEIIKRHYRMKDLSQKTAVSMLTSAVEEAKSLYLRDYPEVKLTAAVSLRGAISVQIA